MQFVYVAFSPLYRGENGQPIVKIGMTDHVKKRWAKYKTFCPDVRMIWFAGVASKQAAEQFEELFFIDHYKVNIKHQSNVKSECYYLTVDKAIQTAEQILNSL
jgi:hypothetical protein